MNKPETTKQSYGDQGQEVIEALNTFLATTAELSSQQLKWLSFLEKLATPETFHSLDQRVEADIEANVILARQVCKELIQGGTVLKVTNPADNMLVPIIGIAYSVENRSYQVGIDPSSRSLIPLSGEGRLQV